MSEYTQKTLDQSAPIKALTILQPYAHLIVVTREKRVENRTWSTRYRGPLVIHAGKGRQMLMNDGQGMSFGAAIGMCNLVECVHQKHLHLHEDFPWLPTHKHALGPWCWILDDVVEFPEPVPFKGAQGLWSFPSELVPHEA